MATLSEGTCSGDRIIDFVCQALIPLGRNSTIGVVMANKTNTLKINMKIFLNISGILPLTVFVKINIF